MFWLEENLTLYNVLITGKSNFDETNVEEMFNWSEVHLENKYYTYKIGTPVIFTIYNVFQEGILFG